MRASEHGTNGEGTARANGEERDVDSHMFRPTVTDMQDKYYFDFSKLGVETASRQGKGRNV